MLRISEWFMGVSLISELLTSMMRHRRQVAALKGYENANMTALDLWQEVYPEGLVFALTDTFSTEAFLKAGLVCLFVLEVMITDDHRVSLQIQIAPAVGEAYGKIPAIPSLLPLASRKCTTPSGSITKKNALSIPTPWIWPKLFN
jgi:hypothetical protein